MKHHSLIFPTCGASPASQIVSQSTLAQQATCQDRAEYQLSALAVRVLKKIERLSVEEMNRADGQEILMPINSPGILGKESGRWSVYVDEMFRLQTGTKGDLPWANRRNYHHPGRCRCAILP